METATEDPTHDGGDPEFKPEMTVCQTGTSSTGSDIEVPDQLQVGTLSDTLGSSDCPETHMIQDSAMNDHVGCEKISCESTLAGSRDDSSQQKLEEYQFGISSNAQDETENSGSGVASRLDSACAVALCDQAIVLSTTDIKQDDWSIAGINTQDDLSTTGINTQDDLSTTGINTQANVSTTGIHTQGGSGGSQNETNHEKEKMEFKEPTQNHEDKSDKMDISMAQETETTLLCSKKQESGMTGGVTPTSKSELVNHSIQKLESITDHLTSAKELCISDASATEVGGVCEIPNRDVEETDVDGKLKSSLEITQETAAENQSTLEGNKRGHLVRYKCLKCFRILKDKKLLEDHSCDAGDGEVKEKTKITIVMDQTSQSLLCKQCEFASSGHPFEEHLMCHLMVRPYQCLYCKECFINRKEISRHVVRSHNGAKMSCALRALKKAKGLIKEAVSSGIVCFLAKVAGKVPLEIDPDKIVSQLENHGDNIRDMSGGKVSSEVETSVSSEKSESDQATRDVHHFSKKVVPGNEHGSSKYSINTDVTRSHAGHHTELLHVQNQAKASCSTPPATCTRQTGTRSLETSSLDTCSSNKAGNLPDLASSRLEKPVSSPSLETESNNQHDTHSKADAQPHFFTSPPKRTNEPVLSFLGPEVPSPDGTNHTPPPPLLHHAPSLSQPKHSTDFFICGFDCPFSSMDGADLQEHLVNVHSAEGSFPCYYCGHGSPNEADLVQHLSNHTHAPSATSLLYVCGSSRCSFGTNLVADFINHFKVVHPLTSDFACYSCGDSFPEAGMLQAHVEYNVIHIVNCPHCSSRATDRRAILNHISTLHPGKPKMVSVFKQLICHDRKINNLQQTDQSYEQRHPPKPAPNVDARTCLVKKIYSRYDLPGDQSQLDDSCLHQGTGESAMSFENGTSPSSKDVNSTHNLVASPDGLPSPSSNSSELGSMQVKDELEDLDESRLAHLMDENGVRKRIYVPMSERQAENYRCQHCTFIARDFKRMSCHEKSHNMPTTRKERFRCMFCPQGFDSEMKFRMHVTCHPGLIKFLLYRCKKCEFDSNQKHIMVRHVSCNRDRKHRGVGPLEDQYTVVSRSLESRVIECEQCDYMTRHKIHMAIHYQKQHNIIKDKAEFSLDTLEPMDTPMSSYDDWTPEKSSPSYQTPDDDQDTFDFPKPAGAAKKVKDKTSSDGSAASISQISERNDLFNRMVAHKSGKILETTMRKFKCPICQYLLPKAADLKNHVKRHSDVGQIQLVMFRCKYCSSMSTAREMIYDHLAEKHVGKPIALVKKIVAIDTADVDRSFAETSMEESLDQLEDSLYKEITNINSNDSSDVASHSSYEELFVIPEEGDTFATPVSCSRCSFSSCHKCDIVQHIESSHPEVKVVGPDDDKDQLGRASQELQQLPVARMTESLKDSQEEVLILPDEPVFSEPALCSRCEFTTMLRPDMVAHLQKNHPEISIMGRNSYPVQVTALGRRPSPLFESCIVGSGSLDSQLKCLYTNYGTHMKCLVCGADRPKKFFIHVHLLRHLNVYLWKCTFCPHKGLQKHKMVDHIKKMHPRRPLSARYLRVSVEDKVAKFLSQSQLNISQSLIDEEGDSPYSPATEGANELIEADSSSPRKSPFQGGDNNSPHTLGGSELDDKIRCMYETTPDGLCFKCQVCPSQFQRKFSMHRHIIISHLKVALLSCAYCGMEGVERHQLVDHILACHKPAAVSIQTLDIDLHKMATDFLARMASKNQNGRSFNPEQDVDEEKYSGSETFLAGNRNLKLTPLKFGKASKPSTYRLGGKDLAAAETTKKRSGDSDVFLLGRQGLDQKLSCLYQERPSGQLRCLVCRWEFPKKYPLHRHILLRHLKLSLVGCAYCPFQGIEKYNVTAHIREEHKDQPINTRYTQPDVEARVRQFVEEMANNGGKSMGDLIQKPTPRSHLLLMPKIEKQSDDESSPLKEENNNDDNEDEEDMDQDEEDIDSRRSHRGGLVVAMFGKKKQFPDFDIKDELEDEEDLYEKDEIETNNEEEDEFENASIDYNEDEDPGADKSNYEPPSSLHEFSSPHKFQESYVPGSYRSPAGGKAKALDVVTKIKVLKAKEGPVIKFYCEKCKFTSLHRSNIVRHIYKIHERYQTQACPMCSYQTLSPMLMQKHVAKVHQGKGDAPKSNSRPKKSGGLFSFQKKKLSPKNKTPEVVVPSATIATKHFACAYCYYETDTQEDIQKHTLDKHSEGGDVVNLKSEPVADLTKIAKAENESPACWDGSKKAVKRRLADDEEDGGYHRKRRFIFEKGNEVIQCGHCETRETSMPGFQEHHNSQHAELPLLAKRIPSWRFVCKSCCVKTMATSKMKYHLNRHINYSPYTCVGCGAFFPSPDQCRRHSRAQGHEEQYMYVRHPKKETKVEELLEASRQLALKIQDEAAKSPDFDIANTDAFIAKFQETKSNLRKIVNGGSRSMKKLARLSQKKEQEAAATVAKSGKSGRKKKAGKGAKTSAGKGAKTAEGGGTTEQEDSKMQKLAAKSPQTTGVEQDVTIKCYRCNFTSSTISAVSTHHKEKHPGHKFYWTEVERGFTCDSSGLALGDSDAMPGESSDVGYTTRMTLGTASNTMRFKCKVCDFSSYVIQAIKSHLKSHQPKGFICPYCSRSFSGKEKLMRHQYCLHKGQTIWVIHLRKPTVASPATVKSKKSITPADIDAVTPAENEDVPPAENEDVSPADSDAVTPADNENVSPADNEDVSPADSDVVTPADHDEAVNEESQDVMNNDDGSNQGDEAAENSGSEDMDGSEKDGTPDTE